MKRFALLLLLPLPLAASSLNIAFHHGTTTEAAMAPGASPAAPGTVVDTAAATWNAITRNGGVGLTFTNVPLVLDSGAASGATATGTGGYSTFNSNGWGGQDKDWVMMEGWYGFRDTETLTVSNLPASVTSGGYHVIVYGDSNNANRTMNYTIGAQTVTIQDSGTFSGTFTEGSHFAILSGLTASSFTLRGNPGAGDPRSAINGIRIVNGDPPSPPVINDFSADDHYVAPGTTVQLSWDVTGADTLSISPEVGVVTDLTSTPVTVDTTTTYTLTATNSDGTTTATLRAGAGPPRPNIVFFLVDDMGWQDTSEPFLHDTAGNEVVTALNQRYRTPNMEILADRGMKFTNAYAMPVCTPTRNCIMTGKNSARHHVTNWTNPAGTNTGQNSTPSHDSPSGWKMGGLDPAEITLPSLLQSAGYRTITAGKAHFGATPYARDPLNVGFDVNIAGSEIGHPGSYTGNYGQGGSRPVPHLEAYHNTGTFLTEALTLEINAAIEEAVNDGAPFYAYMTHYAVHSPFTDDPRFTANYPTLTGNARNYATMIEGMDKSLGDILARLDTLGVAEDTLVIFMSDNGGDAPLGDVNNSNAPLRHKKGSKYEGGVRVPLIAAWAGPNPANTFQGALPIPQGSRQDDIVACFDLYPTFLGVADVAYSHSIDGHDLRPYLRNDPGTHRPQELLIHFPHDHRTDYYTIYRQGDWKLIYNYASDSYELYHLATDLGEATNLAAADPDRVMAMARRMAQELAAAGAQWPTFDVGGADDPFAMPLLPAVDLDNDGLPDNTEDPNYNGLVDPGETNPENDNTDGDPTPDGAETKVGTDPLSPFEWFNLAFALDDTGRVRLTWPSAPGALFRVESSATLQNPWNTVQDDVPAASSAAETTFDAGLLPLDPAHFWRVMVK